jgi:CBS domain-containing protein
MQRAISRVIPQFTRRFSTSTTTISALNVFEKSCYHKVDFKINQNASAQEGVMRFSLFNIGCLAVTNDANKVVGVFSEGDFINKVAALRKDSEFVKIKDVCTMSPNIIIAKKSDTLDECMRKMMIKNLRHLLVVDDENENFFGMISIKDLIKEVNRKNQDIITKLSDFKIGKGAFFGSE